MYKLIILLIGVFLFSGCSIIPRLTMDTPNTLPQSINKNKAKEVCQGKVEWDELGNIKSCSKGYFNYSENFNKQERKMTIVERIKSFINSLVGWGFWGIVILVILCPSLLGLILGRLLEGIYGIGNKALRQVASAVQKVKDNNPTLIQALEASTDEDIKLWLKNFKEQYNIK